MPTKAHKAAGARLVRALALAWALVLALPALGADFYVRSSADCSANGCGAEDGSSYENAFNDVADIAYGAANAFGRGDVLYVCGTLTTGIQLGSVGAFDGTVNADADVVWVKGNCVDGAGNSRPGIIGNPSAAVASGHGIHANGVAAVYVSDIKFSSVFRNGFNQFRSSSAASNCVVSGDYHCYYAKNITCDHVGTDSATGGHCVVTTPTAFGNFPATQTQGILIEDVTSYDGGGAACKVEGPAIGAVIRRCNSVRDGLYADTWGVYMRSEARNIGACSGGQTWSRLNSSDVYKATVATSCIPASLTWAEVQSQINETGADIDPDFGEADVACVDDASCESNIAAGEWGQVGNVIYINRGAVAIASTAAVIVTLAYNTNPIIEYSTATGFGCAHDGYGIGFDLNVVNGVIRYSRSYNNCTGGFSLNLSTASAYSNAAWGTGVVGGQIYNYSLDYGSSLYSSSSGFDGSTGTHVRWRSHFGSTANIKNVAMSRGELAGTDNWEDGGTVNWDYNGYGPDIGFDAYVGSPPSAGTAISAGANDVVCDKCFSPISGAPFLAADSPLIGRGDASGYTYDAFGDALYSDTDIGGIRRDACYRRDRLGALNPARTRSQIAERCRGVPGRYPEGL